MGDHYIPRFYLKGFEDPSRTDFIWVYFRDKPLLHTSIKNIAQENNYYSREIEQRLANEVEEPANQVIRKIREKQDISQEEKLILAKYMIVMWKRVPERKAWIKDKTPEIMNPVFENVNRQLTQLKDKHPEKVDLFEEQIQELQNIKENNTEELIHNVWLDNILPDKTSESIETLRRMTWRFMLAGGEQYFITSDNPLFFFSWIGIGNEKSEVTFPISKSIALWATWRVDIGEGFYPIRRYALNEINRRTVSNITESLYSPYSAEWIKIIASKPKNKIKLNRMM